MRIYQSSSIILKFKSWNKNEEIPTHDNENEEGFQSNDQQKEQKCKTKCNECIAHPLAHVFFHWSFVPTPPAPSSQRRKKNQKSQKENQERMNKKNNLYNQIVEFVFYHGSLLNQKFRNPQKDTKEEKENCVTTNDAL